MNDITLTAIIVISFLLGYVIGESKREIKNLLMSGLIKNRRQRNELI